MKFKHLQEVIDKVKKEYKEVDFIINGHNLGYFKDVKNICWYVFDNKLDGKEKFTLEIYSIEYIEGVKKHKINVEDTDTISYSLMELLENYNVHIDEDKIPSKMLNEYIKSTKRILEKYEIEIDATVRKETLVGTYDISDIVGIEL